MFDEDVDEVFVGIEDCVVEYDWVVFVVIFGYVVGVELFGQYVVGLDCVDLLGLFDCVGQVLFEFGCIECVFVGEFFLVVFGCVEICGGDGVVQFGFGFVLQFVVVDVVVGVQCQFDCVGKVEVFVDLVGQCVECLYFGDDLVFVVEDVCVVLGELVYVYQVVQCVVWFVVVVVVVFVDVQWQVVVGFDVLFEDQDVCWVVYWFECYLVGVV